LTRNDKTTPDWWNFYVDGASNVKGSEARTVLEGPENVTLERAFKLNFKASNN